MGKCPLIVDEPPRNLRRHEGKDNAAREVLSWTLDYERFSKGNRAAGVFVGRYRVGISVEQ
jgi:hypothetical protein